MAISELLQVSARLKVDLPWIVEAKYFDKVDSTQSRIIQWLPKLADGAVVVIGETQSKGVGRQGREWISPPGGLWFTLALPLSDISIEKIGAFSLVTALQVSNALKEVNNLECQVKWPNDILAEGKKVAGILLSTTTKYKKDWLLIGVGVNVNNAIPKELSQIAIAIKDIRKQTQGRSRLLEAVLSAIYTAWKDYPSTGFGPYQKAFETKLFGIGKKTKVQMGDKTIQGTLSSVDTEGNLLLESASGIKKVYAGEIVGQPA
ncbi:MAG: biotin--[acetyl-CoA-carboxylase] ligase [Elusimicrobiota bacterium]